MTDADIALAHRLADAAGAAIRPFYRQPCAHETKADRSAVTEADRAAEAAMRRLIEAEYPRDAIQGEEYGLKPGHTGRTWVLDPIDGTRSFVAGRPLFGTLVALLADGWPVLGAIDQPITGERWIGAAGRATTLNGKPARTAPCPRLATAQLSATAPELFGETMPRFQALLAKTDTSLTVWGGDCISYGLVASGHLDLVVERGLALHDFAALVPVVEGAGGRICDWAGEPLNAESEGDVIALGDPARMDDVMEALRS